MSQPIPEKGKIQAICFGLLAVTILVYLPSFSLGFVNYDDPEYVTNNPHVLAGLSLRRIGWAFLVVHASNWHPLTWISHMLDASLFGAGPTGPHIVNVLFHAANAVLLFLVLRKASGALWRSALVAALFALHPLHVESVSWISERKDVLSTFFGLLTLWNYAVYVKDSQAGRPQKKNFRLALFFFAAALLSKPMLVTLPFAMLLLDYWPLQRLETTSGGHWFSKLLELVKEKAPFLCFSAVSCLLTLKAQAVGDAPLAASPLGSRVETVFIAYAQYLGQAIWPARLNCLYLHPGSWPMPQVIVCAAVVVGISLVIFAARRKYPFAVMGWLWFLGLLVPVIGLVPVGLQYMADRYTYLPLMGIFVMVIWGWGEVVTRWRNTAVAGYVAAIVVLAACSARTWSQESYWQNSGTLFQHAIEEASSGGNYVAQNNLGFYFLKQGDFDKAAENFKKALELKPDFGKALKNLGTALISAKRFDEAIVCYQTMLQQYRPDEEMYNNLGLALAARGRTDEAVDAYRKALSIAPDDSQAKEALQKLEAGPEKTAP